MISPQVILKCPIRWNEKAAIQLAHLIEEVRKCSIGISYITSLPKMPPTNAFSAYKAAIKYISEIALAKYKISNSSSSKAMSPICVTTKGATYIKYIKLAAMGL